jgi:hypothetical protein
MVSFLRAHAVLRLLHPRSRVASIVADDASSSADSSILGLPENREQVEHPLLCQSLPGSG